jgi:hypothetical protein
VLELRTGAEVVVLNPFVNVDVKGSLFEGVDMMTIGNVLSVAMGLATRS